MLVGPNARWRSSSQLSPSTGVTTCAYPDTDSSTRRRTPTAYDPIVDFLFVVRSIFVLLGLVVSGCLFAVVRRPPALRCGRLASTRFVSRPCVSGGPDDF